VGETAAGQARPLPRHVRIAIIGAGFGGIGAGIRLLQPGRTGFIILERASSIGGTWRDNSYPGCTCDIPSHIYSYSFAPNPGWSHSFSRQPEILAYLSQVAGRYQLPGHIRLETEVREARWDHAADLAGRRVAVVGTGASAIQIVPSIQPVVQRRTGVAALEPRPAAEQRWNVGLQQRMRSTVWMTGGCVSWYLNSAGGNPTLWPGSVGRFRRATRHLDLAEYTVLPAGAG
jgi:cation diffusion facilitator CzcD-associated flavoprotein CzcO